MPGTRVFGLWYSLPCTAIPVEWGKVVSSFVRAIVFVPGTVLLIPKLGHKCVFDFAPTESGTVYAQRTAIPGYEEGSAKDPTNI
eukprot:1498-Rhodomonas_salina.2